MSRNFQPPPEPTKNLPQRVPWIVGLLFFGCLLATSFTVILFGIEEASCAPEWLEQLAKTARLRPPWLIISGLATAPSLVLTWIWRTRHKDEDLAFADTASRLARREELSTRFFEAVKLLAEDKKLEARLGALYALESMVADAPTESRKVTETICAYLRARFQAEPDPDAPGRPPVDAQAAFTILGRMVQSGGDDPSPIELTGLYLRHFNGKSSQFARAHFGGTDFTGASFELANLTNVLLPYAKLCDAYMLNSDLRGANLRRADLRGAHLQGADLRGAQLEAANFLDVGLEEVQLDGATYDRDTVLPPGTVPSELGLKLVPPLSEALATVSGA